MRILCFGDSNTYGYDPRSYFGGRYGPEDRWVDLLEAQTGWTVVNLGKSGREIPRRANTIRHVTELLEPAPDLFLVMLGTNDLLQGATPAEVCDRMEAFLTSLPLRPEQILLLAPPPMKRGAWVPEDALVTASIQLAEGYRRLAQRLGVSFADASSWEVALTFDGVHFTEEGNHAFARGLRAALVLTEPK